MSGDESGHAIPWDMIVKAAVGIIGIGGAGAIGVTTQQHQVRQVEGVAQVCEAEREEEQAACYKLIGHCVRQIAEERSR